MGIELIDDPLDDLYKALIEAKRLGNVKEAREIQQEIDHQEIMDDIDDY